MKNRRLAHACSFVDSIEDEARSLVPWLATGLKSGERLLLLIEPDRRAVWEAAFAELAIDPKIMAENGSIVFQGPLSEEPGEQFNALRTARRLWSTLEQSLPGSEGLRILIAMQWVQDTGLPADRLCHWEATLDYLVSDVPNVRVMCQYNRRRLRPAALHAALRTHAVTEYQGRMTISPFYESARILEDEPNFAPCIEDAAVVDRMLREVHPELP